jgi:hypothetical protein
MAPTAVATIDGKPVTQAEARLIASLELESDTLIGYVSKLGTQVRDWTGTAVYGRITRRTVRKHMFGNPEWWYIRMVDANGVTWYGQGPGIGMYVKLRRSKRQKGN